MRCKRSFTHLLAVGTAESLLAIACGQFRKRHFSFTIYIIYNIYRTCCSSSSRMRGRKKELLIYSCYLLQVFVTRAKAALHRAGIYSISAPYIYLSASSASLCCRSHCALHLRFMTRFRFYFAYTLCVRATAVGLFTYWHRESKRALECTFESYSPAGLQKIEMHRL